MFFCLKNLRWALFCSYVLLSNLTAAAQDFIAMEIPDSVWLRMQGKTYVDNPHIRRSDLRYLRVKHWDYDNRSHQGEMVCNKLIADKLIAIFRELYAQHYPIERIALIDDYEADDERSMTANNTSCFCYRRIAGSNKLSKHSLGMAIDINPLQNPCVKPRRDGSIKVQPQAGRKYIDRQKAYPYKITKDDLCYRLFLAHGFSWGGNWRSSKDYQHFEK